MDTIETNGKNPATVPDEQKQPPAGLRLLQHPDDPGDLLVLYPNGEEKVLSNYLVLADPNGPSSPPDVTLEDGTVIAGNSVLALIENLDFTLLSAPAAGFHGSTPTQTGAAFRPYQSESLGLEIGHGPYKPAPPCTRRRLRCASRSP